MGRFVLIVATEFFTSTASFGSNILTAYDGLDYYTNNTLGYDQKIGVINGSFGIGYKF